MTAVAIPALPQSVLRRALRDALVVLGLAVFLFEFLAIAPQDRGVGSDAYAYWAVKPAAPYGLPEGQIGAFPYSPPIVRVFSLASNLSWTDFWWLWTWLLVATVIWLGWRRIL